MAVTLHRFQDKARWWLKVVIFFITLHLTSPLEGLHWYIACIIWCGKTSLVWLTDGVKIDDT